MFDIFPVRLHSRRHERTIRWRREDGPIAPGYSTVPLIDPAEETLSATPPPVSEKT
jgi:hypothetical protein